MVYCRDRLSGNFRFVFVQGSITRRRMTRWRSFVNSSTLCRSSTNQKYLECTTTLTSPSRSVVHGLSQIPLRYLVVDRSELVADGFEAGRRPAASWNLAYQGTRLKQVCDKSATSLGPVCDQDSVMESGLYSARSRRWLDGSRVRGSNGSLF